MLRSYSKPINDVRVTVVGEYSEGVLNMSVACCSKHDNFMKKKGAAIAEGRFNKGMYIRSVEASEETVRNFLVEAQRVAEEVAVTHEVVSGRTYQGDNR